MKLWSGRFEKNTDAAMDAFHSSISFDSRLYREDIAGSIAHAKMLGKQGIIPQKDAEEIIAGLQDILADIEAGKVQFTVGAEDIHMNVESLLTERIGTAGKRVHTGRSRNDQVALDMRLYMKSAIARTVEKLTALLGAILENAARHTHTVMPGYTHLQKAQPITLAHHDMAYFEMFYRDATRMLDCRRRADVLPLGAGALAGTTYPLDRAFVAQELGFAEVGRNSLDCVSDRDFCVEYCAAASLVMMHLSRFCEELILFNSDEFRFVEMDDAYSTGSSIMPQKKNPDVAELIRGKTGRVYGDLTALLTVMKGIPLAYNKDMQEDKESTFDAVDTVIACLDMFTRMYTTLRYREDRMHEGARHGFTNATDAADYLVKKGLPFRTAHEIIGALVLQCIKEGRALDDLTLEELRTHSSVFGEDYYEAISLKTCVEGRALTGGPAPAAVQAHIAQARELLKELEAQNA